MKRSSRASRTDRIHSKKFVRNKADRSEENTDQFLSGEVSNEKKSNKPYYLEAKKSLGQNFLKNTTIIKRIAEAGEIKPNELIIEIGPGTGELTHGLLEQGGHVIAIEKDRRAIPILEERFKKAIKDGLLEVIEGDYLEMNVEEMVTSRNTTDFKIIANIPYYITGLIIRKSLELRIKPAKLIFLVQKEVAERMTEVEGKKPGAKAGKGSILAQSIQAYGKARILCIVSKGNFVPAPKVDSAVIIIEDISSQAFESFNVSEKDFFDVLHAGFAHKRKKLLVNLLDSMIETMKTNNSDVEISRDLLKTELINFFTSIDLNEQIRAEEITHETWFKIAEWVSKKIKKA